MGRKPYLWSLMSLCFLGALCPAMMAWARSLPSSSNTSAQTQSSSLISLKFPPVDDRRSPQRTTGAGTRGPGCLEDDNSIPLMSLMPTRNNWGTTIAAHPTLYWYVPKTSANSGEFVMFDQAGNEVYQATFIPPTTPGMVKLSLPPDVALEVEQNYDWYFSIICDPNDRSQDLFVKGSIYRSALSASLQNQLATLAPLERAKIYAQNKIWQETLNTMAQVRSEYDAEWSELLESVGLGMLAQTPLQDCCTLED